MKKFINKFFIFLFIFINLNYFFVNSIQTTTTSSGLTTVSSGGSTSTTTSSSSTTGGSGTSSPIPTHLPNKACSVFPPVKNNGYDFIQIHIYECTFTNKYQNSLEDCTFLSTRNIAKGSPIIINNDTNSNLYFDGQNLCSFYNQSIYYTSTQTTEYNCLTECLNMREPLATGFIKEYMVKDLDQYGNVWTDWSGFIFNFTNPNPTPTKTPIFPCSNRYPIVHHSGPEYIDINYYTCTFEGIDNTTTCKNNEYTTITLQRGIPLFKGEITNYTSEFTLFYDGQMVCVIFLHYEYYCKNNFIHNTDYCTNTCAFITDNSTQIVNYHSNENYCESTEQYEINYYYFNLSNVTNLPNTTTIPSGSYSYSYSIHYESSNENSDSSNNFKIINLISLNLILLFLLLNLLIN